MPCPEHPSIAMLVRKNANGTLSARCEECDDTHYAKDGTGKHAAWQKKITKLPGASEAPKPESKKPDEKKATAAGFLPEL